MGRKNASRIKRRNERAKAYRRKQEYGKLFNGNIYAQWEFVFIWGLILAFALVPAVYIFLDNRPIKRENCAEERITVKTAEVTEENDSKRLEILLYDENEYTVKWYSDKLYDFSEKASEKTAYVLTCKNEVVGLTLNDEEYLSIDEVNERRKDIQKISYIFLIVGAVWLLYVAVSWYVMYNAEKFPRLIKYFVKPEYINKEKVRLPHSDSHHRR